VLDSDAELERLRAEHAEWRIGVLILEECRHAANRVVRPQQPRYPAASYSETGAWDPFALEGLTQQLVETLLAERWLERYLTTVSTIGQFRRLLEGRVRQMLARTRRRTVVDNLIDRAKKIVADGPPFTSEGTRDSLSYRLVGDRQAAGRPSEADIDRAARKVTRLPHIIPRTQAGTPHVYSDRILRLILEIMARELPPPVTVSDLASVLDRVLTAKGFCLPHPEEMDPIPDPAQLTPEEDAQTRQTSSSVHDQLTERQRAVLNAKLRGDTDATIASALGVSRQTVDADKRHVIGVIRQAAEGLDERLEEALIERLELTAVGEEEEA
jgi:DNA-binding CsgD family transcriptional regulator